METEISHAWVAGPGRADTVKGMDTRGEHIARAKAKVAALLVELDAAGDAGGDVPVEAFSRYEAAVQHLELVEKGVRATRE